MGYKGFTFDKLLELKAPGAAVTATGSTTGVQLEPRFIDEAAVVLAVTAIEATDTNETYVVAVEVSDLVGGTYTPIASVTIPRGTAVPFSLPISINGQVSQLLDNDSAFIRLTYTLGGTTPSLTFSAYLAKV